MSTNVHVLIAGGRGFLGTALTRALLPEGHAVSILTRRREQAATASTARRIHWDPNDATGAWIEAIPRADVLINLAGESIARWRWTAARKHRILHSRRNATSTLVTALLAAPNAPRVFVSSSAVGYYGPRFEETLTEDACPGSDFLASVCAAWEVAAAPAATRTRVVILRTGLPLSRRGGALPKMVLPFWFGAGGRLGSGQQYSPWIHLRDWVDAVRFAIANETVAGPINVTAPVPVTNAAFATALGRAMHRPALLPTPGFALELLLGEMADALLLSGQRAVPDKLRRLGYTFRFDSVDAALSDLFR